MIQPINKDKPMTQAQSVRANLKNILNKIIIIIIMIIIIIIKLADIDFKTTEKTSLLAVVLDNKFKFNDHISSVWREVSAQICALNRLTKMLPLKTKESLYHAFILSY